MDSPDVLKMSFQFQLIWIAQRVWSTYENAPPLPPVAVP
jgi:hypothetical protein